ncbi:MAG: phosphate-starvation-inducible PsiE family protein [Sulfolobaceae archaeon]|nr:phosphate-starvation-inducible PsiE family protein [Sulfolobaceae archaeon]
MKKFNESSIINLIGIIIRALLIFVIFAQLAYTLYHITVTIRQGFEEFIDSTIIDTLLVLVLLEIYLGIADYIKGTGRTVVYVIDATISYLVREIVIQALNPQGLTMTTIIAYAGGVLALAASRFLISRTTQK